MADESSAFAGGLFDNTRRAADQLSITVKSVDQTLAGLSAAVAAIAQKLNNTSFGGSTSPTSQSGQTANGGQVRFTSPATGQPNNNGGGGGAGNPPSSPSSGGGRGTPTMQSRAAAVGVGLGLANNLVGSSNDSYLAADMLRNGYGGTSDAFVRSLRGWNGSTSDLSSGFLSLQMAGQSVAGSAASKRMFASIGSSSFTVPGMSNTQAIGLSASLRSAGTANRLLMSGFSAYDGSDNSMRNIARQIIQKSGLSARRDLTPEQITAAVYAPNGTFVQTLNTLVQQGALPAEAIQAIQGEGAAMLNAQQQGVGSAQYEQNMQRAAKDPTSSFAKNWTSQVAKTGVNTRSANYSAQRESDERSQNALGNVDDFASGLETSTSALSEFNKVLRNITDSQLGQAYSEGKGIFAGLGNWGMLSGLGRLIPGRGGPVGMLGGSGGDSGGPIATFSAASSWSGFSEASSISGALTGGGSSYALGVGGSTMSPNGSTSGSSGASFSGGTSSGSAGVTPSTSPGGYAGGSGGTNVLRWPTTSKSTSNKHSYPAIDIDGRMGDPIYASLTGKVASVTLLSSSYGHHIKIDHGNGVFTLYAHLGNRNGQGGSGVLVRAGQTVRQGQKIGTMGNTGHVIAGPGGDGSHLHFELSLGGNSHWGSNSGSTVQPLPYLRGTPIKQLSSLATADKKSAGKAAGVGDSGGPTNRLNSALSMSRSASFWNPSKTGGMASQGESSGVESSDPLGVSGSAVMLLNETIKKAFTGSSGSPLGASKNSQGVNLVFNPGSIVLSVGAGASIGQGRALATEFVNTLTTDSRIKEMQAGR